MTKQGFLSRLRAGLKGLPAATADDIVSDYDAHFAEALAAGRSEEEVAQALGDPGRLARELRAEQGLKRWEAEKNPAAAAGAVLAVLGLGAFDILVLLPVLLGVGAALFGFAAGAVGVFVTGGWMLVSGATGHFAGGGLSGPQVFFVGLGLMSGAAGFAALLVLAVVGLVNALVWYGRLHYRLLKPAVET